jgi:hypothetical protein
MKALGFTSWALVAVSRSGGSYSASVSGLL